MRCIVLSLWLVGPHGVFTTLGSHESVLYRKWAYTMYTQMRRCHEYVDSNMAQGHFLVAAARYRILQNLGRKTKEITR